MTTLFFNQEEDQCFLTISKKQWKFVVDLLREIAGESICIPECIPDITGKYVDPEKCYINSVVHAFINKLLNENSLGKIEDILQKYERETIQNNDLKEILHISFKQFKIII